MGKNKQKKHKKQARKAQSNKHVKHQHQQKGKKWRKQQQKKNGSEWNKHFKEFQDKINNIGLYLRDIEGDGNCLFRAVADQIEGNQGNYKEYRQLATQFLLEQQDYFAPFIEDDQTYEEYVKDMQDDGTWGGHLELQALSMGLEVNFVLHLIDRPVMVIRNNYKQDSRIFHLAYHLGENIGEHYSSVRLMTDIDNTPAMQIKHIYYEEIFLQNNSDFNTLEKYQQEKFEQMDNENDLEEDKDESVDIDNKEDQQNVQNQNEEEKQIQEQKINNNINIQKQNQNDTEEEETKLNDTKVIENLKLQNQNLNQQVIEQSQQQPNNITITNQKEQNQVNKQQKELSEDEKYIQQQIELINMNCQLNQVNEEEFIRQQIEMINQVYGQNDNNLLQNPQNQQQQQNGNQIKIQNDQQKQVKNQEKQVDKKLLNQNQQQQVNSKNYPRNKKCYCGSKHKYKNCCLSKDLEKEKIINPELFVEQQNNQVQIDKSQISDKIIIA